MDAQVQQLMRRVPSVDTVLKEPSLEALAAEHGRKPVADAVREAVEEVRRQLLAQPASQELVSRASSPRSEGGTPSAPRGQDALDTQGVPPQDDKPKLHLGFIEEWYIVNPSALLGILIAFFLPRTKFPHAGHILISTWASAAHIMMNTHSSVTAATVVGMFIVLFIAVWFPCCFSDIVFPMLLVGGKPGHAHDHHHCCSEAVHERQSQS